MHIPLLRRSRHNVDPIINSIIDPRLVRLSRLLDRGGNSDEINNLIISLTESANRLRAEATMQVLEGVSEDLLSRYEAVRGKDRNHPEEALCCVCCERLGPMDDSQDVQNRNRAEPENDIADAPTVEDHNHPKSGNNIAHPLDPAIPRVVAIPCKHLFHSKCLALWLAERPVCPLCRSDADYSESSSEPQRRKDVEAWVKAEEKMKFPRNLDQRCLKLLRILHLK